MSIENQGPTVPEQQLSKIDRLLEVLTDELVNCTGAFPRVSIETLAQRAGVSRATAYRYLRNGRVLRVQVALLHVDNCARVKALARSHEVTACQQIAAIMAFWAVELNELDIIRLDWWSPELDGVRVRARRAIEAHLLPVLRSGQEDHQLRTDLPVSELVGWLIEQSMLLIGQRQTREQAVRWLQRFVVPAVRCALQSDVLDPDVKAAIVDMDAGLLRLSELAASAVYLAQPDEVSLDWRPTARD